MHINRPKKNLKTTNGDESVFEASLLFDVVVIKPEKHDKITYRNIDFVYFEIHSARIEAYSPWRARSLLQDVPYSKTYFLEHGDPHETL